MSIQRIILHIPFYAKRQPTYNQHIFLCKQGGFSHINNIAILYFLLQYKQITKKLTTLHDDNNTSRFFISSLQLLQLCLVFNSFQHYIVIFLYHGDFHQNENRDVKQKQICNKHLMILLFSGIVPTSNIRNNQIFSTRTCYLTLFIL